MEIRLGKCRLVIDFGFPAMLALLFLQPDRPVRLLLVSLLHETGHGLAMALTGAGLREIRFYAAGIQMRTNPLLLHKVQLVCIYLSGPLVNLLSAYALRGTETGMLHLLTGCFNLLPFRILDGGALLHCLTEEHKETAELVLTVCCLLLSAGMLAGLLLYRVDNPVLYLMVIYLAVSELHSTD